MSGVKRYKTIVFVVIFLVVDVVLIRYAFFSDKKSDAVEDQLSVNPSAKELADGKALALQYCQSCHMLPDPNLLTKEMWYRGALPRMGPFLGITKYHGQGYYRARDVKVSDYFPSHPIIDSVKWGSIVNYYIASAPVILPAQKRPVSIERGNPFFEVLMPKDSVVYGKMALTSFVKIDTSVNPHRLMVSDGMASKMLVFDNKLNLLSQNSTSGPVVDFDLSPNNMLYCSIGQDMSANNLHNGEIVPVKIGADGKLSWSNEPLFTKLARPVKVTGADLNSDGRKDYLISEFGNLVGKLSWMESKGNGQYTEHILRNRPGALGTIVQDYNHDGRPDIWAQFAQGEEGIFLYTNKGNGHFDEREVLRFPPAYGSTSFNLVDFNHDGYTDIIYTCGDNGDYTQILKPYHGVYIFINDGKNNFSQKYFFPINGCYKAIVKDFDGDGDLDIATISFFPAAAQPEEAFVYLENKGGFNFKAWSLPVKTPFQKGITMDVADADGDGKPDILLGNGYFSTDNLSTHKEPLFILLKNKTTSIKH
ncbi:FG-GAP repeat domain-containing protein [Mucilaginibacter jinjuensis]|uniref:VCBS repeat-containing protein n=1 Tax=Mucilaginibacter jinjuensis TaxID=1176721 RepID=A0ABY7TFJ1_9SPHI|nr:VCBS repeat-containing protein [Mucilaginibacter jinjuensis]WCT14859.1 VCBS repeat-containing protein [Mucilaginibacter jinjuensis]